MGRFMKLNEEVSVVLSIMFLLPLFPVNNFMVDLEKQVPIYEGEFLPFGNSWIRIFGGLGFNKVYCVRETRDNGYIVLGLKIEPCCATWLIKLNKHGYRVWERFLYGGEGFYIDVTSDGGYIITGLDDSGGVWLVKTDKFGREEWHRSFGGEIDVGYSVHETSDNGFIIVGSSTGDDSYDIWLIKTDGEGKLMWDRVFDRGFDEIGCCIYETSDGGYIIAGNSIPFNDENIWVIKTDLYGNKIWDKVFNGVILEGESIDCIDETSDNGYIITGSRYLTSYQKRGLLLVKLDDQGNEIWNKTYVFRGYNYNEGCSVEETSDGGYIIVGIVLDIFKGCLIWFIKTDDRGVIKWDRTFPRLEGLPLMFYGRNVHQTSDGGYIIAGGVSTFMFDETSDILVIKTDSNGNILIPRV